MSSSNREGARPAGRLIGSGRWAVALRALTLAASDAVALVASSACAYRLWAGSVLSERVEVYLDLWPLVLLFLFGYAQEGLYPGFGLGPVETLRRQTLVTTAAFVVLAAASFLVKLPPIYSRVTFAIAFLLALVVVPTLRALVVAAASRWRWWPRPVLVAADSALAAGRFAADLERLPQFGYRVCGEVVADDAGEITVVMPGEAPFPLEDAPRWGAEAVLIDAELAARPGALDRLQGHFRRLIVVRRLIGLPIEGGQVRHLGAWIGVEYTSNLLRRRNVWLKRGLDLAFGLVTAIVSLPIVALGALAVLVADGRPVLLFHERTGRAGSSIRVPKLRTMRRDAEARLERLLVTDPAVREEWERSFKLRRDPRLIPGIGALLRRLSIDELPQLASVLTGAMSIVGPRPFPRYHLAKLPADFVALRERVRPGVTGLWQISTRSDGGLGEQQALDSYYIRNWSLWLDVYILARTAGAVVRGRGAY